MFNGNGLTRTTNDNDEFQYNARRDVAAQRVVNLSQRPWVTGALYSEARLRVHGQADLRDRRQLREERLPPHHHRRRPQGHDLRLRRRSSSTSASSPPASTTSGSARRRPAPSSTPTAGSARRATCSPKRKWEVAVPLRHVRSHGPADDNTAQGDPRRRQLLLQPPHPEGAGGLRRARGRGRQRRHQEQGVPAPDADHLLGEGFECNRTTRRPCAALGPRPSTISAPPFGPDGSSVDAQVRSRPTTEDRPGRLRQPQQRRFRHHEQPHDALGARPSPKMYPNVKVQVEGKGSSTAPPALIAGTAQFGPMSPRHALDGDRPVRGEVRLQADRSSAPPTMRSPST